MKFWKWHKNVSRHSRYTLPPLVNHRHIHKFTVLRIPYFPQEAAVIYTGASTWLLVIKLQQVYGNCIESAGIDSNILRGECREFADLPR